jgi:hypothetical protein
MPPVRTFVSFVNFCKKSLSSRSSVNFCLPGFTFASLREIHFLRSMCSFAACRAIGLAEAGLFRIPSFLCVFAALREIFPLLLHAFDREAFNILR